jgi:hypothetical protein
MGAWTTWRRGRASQSECGRAGEGAGVEVEAGQGRDETARRRTARAAACVRRRGAEALAQGEAPSVDITDIVITDLVITDIVIADLVIAVTRRSPVRLTGRDGMQRPCRWLLRRRGLASS